MKRERTVLVMWEYCAAHSPLWGRSGDLDIGQLDARDLGLPEALRDDLADWNSRCEIAADPNELFVDATTPSGWRALQAESFGLAARVQRGLGDAWTVWCLAGGGDGGLRDPGAFAATRRSGGPQLLLTASGIVEWTPDWTEPRLDRFGATLRRDIHAWIGSADRLSPAQYRTDALETAGRLHASLASGRVLWFGGEESRPEHFSLFRLDFRHAADQALLTGVPLKAAGTRKSQACCGSCSPTS